MIIVVLCAFTLCACDGDKQPDGQDNATYGLRLLGFTYGEDGETMTAYVGICDPSSDSSILNIQAASDQSRPNMWFYEYTTRLLLPSKTIFSAVDEAMTQEDRQHDGQAYNRLKVVFRYDTIYKSVKTNGQVTKYGRYFLHAAELSDEQDRQVFAITQTGANSANWYSALLAVVIVAFVAAMAVYLAIKRKHGKDRTEKSE